MLLDQILVILLNTILLTKLLVMKQLLQAGLKTFALPFFVMFSLSLSAQKTNKIDWSRDTVSKADAIGAKNTFLNTVRASGQKNATERINLPVDKLKEIVDACAAYNVTDLVVMIVTLRQSDVEHYKKNNPGTIATDSDIKGSQMLVFRVPRQAFAGAAGAKTNLSGNNPLMISLLSAGLVRLEAAYNDTPFASGDYYFSFGSICPPPNSCDSVE